MDTNISTIPGVVDHGRGPTIQIRSGALVPILDLQPADIDIMDIAASLSKICRFTGHSHSFYSVAQHSVLVSMLVPFEYALDGLLHDAAEAYIGDISKPLKQVFEMKAPGMLKGIEDKLDETINRRFGLTWTSYDLLVKPWVKHADLVALATEKRDLMASARTPWTALPDPHPDVIAPLLPPAAESLFLDRYFYLTAWHPIATAPKRARHLRVKMVSGKVYDDAHWASDLSGEEQPPFQGWFVPAGTFHGAGFNQIDEPTHWAWPVLVNPPTTIEHDGE